ncbi:MAG TPA: hypothetical protein VG407_03890 [Caulobacteraceae bacterium]|jgi:hypothetical protein|nr:hypothetical protein [Caulobacteraceae bacterium]
MHSHGRVLVFGLLALALCACGKKAAGTLLAAPNPSQAQSGYRAPPQVFAVRAQPGGEIEIDGVAAPDARVGGETPDRKRYGATAAKSGRFTLEMPASAAPQLIAVSEETGRRDLQADGWLFVPPDAPERAVVLRAGASTRPLQAGLVGTIDFDANGAAAISGVTAPGVEADVSIDGGTPVRAIADARGVWEAHLGVDKHIAPASHQVRVVSRSQSFDRSFDFSVGASGPLFNPVREPDGWRVAWKTPDGAVQTTFVFVGAQRS